MILRIQKLKMTAVLDGFTFTVLPYFSDNISILFKLRIVHHCENCKITRKYK